MRRVVLVGVGFLLTLAGVVFTLQGVGVLGGSVMSGVTFSSTVPYLSPAQLRAALDVRALSDPAAGPHAIQILTDRAVAALARAWSCEVRWCRGSKIVPVADNYDRLGYAPGAITREAR